MRGKHYDANKRRVLPNGGYAAIFIAIIVVAALLALMLLVFLPSTEPEKTSAPTIVGMSYDDKDIGVGKDLSTTLITVTYSNGTTEKVAISNMVSEGLDVSVSGEQSVSLSYGGFEQVITINVKDVDCTLKYVASTGGMIQGETEQLIVSGSDGATVIAVPETGYVFKMWSDGYPKATRKDVKVNESKQYIAIFEKAKFRVTFFYNDGTVAVEETVVYGEKATKAPIASDPKLNVYGYTFTGWSVSAEDFSNVTRDMNVYPQYIKTATDVNVSVSIDQFGSSMGMTDANESGYYAYDELATITATPYNSREFNCWRILNGSGVYEILNKEEERIIVIGDNAVNVTFKSTRSGNSASQYILSFTCTSEIDSITLEAVFVYMSSSVTFINYQNSKANNQEYYIDGISYGTTLGEYTKRYIDGIDNTVSVNEDTGIIEPAPVTGMTFLGWYMKGDNSQKIITSMMLFSEPTTLVAKWEKQTYTIKFVYYDESNIEQQFGNINVVYQSTIGSGGGVPSGAPEKNKYTFIGWMDALTGDMVDDKTQISLKTQYLSSDDFVQNNLIKIVAKWAPVEHTLSVITSGEGIVQVKRINSDNTFVTESILGTYSIYETYKYEVAFLADSGNTISSVEWSHDTELNIYDRDITTLTITLQETSDNVINVTFTPLTFNVTINNGDGIYGGHITNQADDMIYDANEFSLEIDYANTLSLNVVSYNKSYAIKKITVTGKINGRSYNNENWATNLEEQEILEYKLILEKCTSDVMINISYTDRKYYVTVNQPSDGGTIKTTKYNGSESEYATPASQTEYAFGSNVFYVITAENGKYISSVNVNGVKYDIYMSGNANVVFYDWKINDKPLGITLINIDGTYYYNYGMAKVDGTEYMYCEEVVGGNTVIFTVINAENEEYEPLVMTYGRSVGASEYATIYAKLISALKINEKRLSDAATVKDLRVTEVKIMYFAVNNVTLSAAFNEIEYNVSVNESERGTCVLTAETVKKNASATINATPITGYTITGYSVNGGEIMSPPTTITEGATCSIKFDNIDEDKNVEIIYAPIAYNIVFADVTIPSKATVNVNNGDGTEHVLASSYSFNYDYASHGSFVLSVEEGKYFTSVKIDGVEQPIIYGAVQYTYTNNHIISDKRIEVKWTTVNSVSTVNGYSVNIDDGNMSNAVGGVEYGASEEEDNIITVIANSGYKIRYIYLKGNYGGNWREITITVDESVTVADTMGLVNDGIISDVLYANDNKQALAITLGSDAFDEIATLYVTTMANVYTLSVNCKGNGSVDATTSIVYGEVIPITVTADSHYYISSFKIDKKEISFMNGNWSNLNYVASIGKYIGGTYSFIASGDVNVEVEFEIYSYKVILDAGSTNGTTVLSVNGRDEAVRSINYGENLIISMKADEGYHIADILINGNSVNYKPYSTIINNNITDTFTLENGASRNITVKVVYEINRYGFTYEIENASENFKGDSGAGALVAGFTPVAGRTEYTGIAHGENFFFEVNPVLSAGYYLYSVTIKYKGYGATDTSNVTRTYTDADGIVNSNGGAIWFNRFMFGNNTDAATGVTADIELIKVTLKRKIYNISFEQLSSEESGTVVFAATNPGRIDADVVLFDEDGNLYYYRPSNAVIYTKTAGGEYLATDIELRYSENEWKFISASNNQIYNMYFEHGLRYVINVTPSEGYERIAFTINGEDRSSSVNANKYGTNIYVALVIQVEYKILTFAVSITVRRGERVTSTSISADTIKLVDTKTNDVLAANDGQSDSLSVQLDYGTKIKLVIVPPFDEYGIYLSGLSVNGLQQGGLGDVTGTVTYGGDGVKLIENLVLAITFKVMQYSVTLNTLYEEEIRNETLNSFANDSTGAFRWNDVFWNDSTIIKIIAGEGYFVDKLVIKYTKNGEEETVTINNYNTIEESYGTISSGFIIVRNSNSPIYGLRDTLTLYGIKSNYTVSALFRRESYKVMYTVNDLGMLENITTNLNTYSSSYPRASSTSLIVNVHSYDELTVNIKPKDGYEITAASIEVQNVVWDAEKEEYVLMRDENDNALIKTFKLTSLGKSDEKTFTFHEATKPNADYYIGANVKIYINLSIKQYTLGTTISRTSAIGDTTGGNNTDVTLTVRDLNGEWLMLAGQAQRAIVFKAGSATSILTAEHHGTINYNFSVPSGYYLDGFTINGFTKENLMAKGILNAVERKEVNSGGAYYTYDYTLSVNTTLINGSSDNPWNGASKINVEISLLPIIYDIKIIINDTEYDYGVYNNRNGVSDGKQIIVYGSSSVTHFNMFTIEPSMYEGYEILASKIYFGNANEYDSTLATTFSAETIKKRTTFAFSSLNMKNTDVLTYRNNDNEITKDPVTTVYFVFTTKIISYSEKIGTTVYYNDDGELKTVDYTDNEAAGDISITVMQGEEIVENTQNGAINGKYEYFSLIQITASANDGYALYGIYEKVDGEWVAVGSGLRGISYLITTEGSKKTHVLTYSVNSVGDREFRVDFKQTTTVTLHVANPYKFVSGGTVNYLYYTSVIAFENGIVVSPNVKVGETGNKVRDVYEYNMYVGNNLLFMFNDSYAVAAQAGVNYYAYDLGELATELIENEACYDNYVNATNKGDFNETKFKTIYDTRSRTYERSSLINGEYQIVGNEEFYMYTNVYARSTIVKNTISAIPTETGGYVYYNNSNTEAGGNILYNVNTVAGNVIKLKITATDNHVFYRIKAKQIDYSATKKEGKVVFASSEQLKWLWLTKDQIDNNEVLMTFNANNQNSYKLLNYTYNSDAKQYWLYIWACGDMEFEVEYYHTYNVTYGIYRTDVVARYGETEGITSSGITISEVSDAVFGSNALSTSSTNATVSYNAEFKIKAETPEGNYEFVGWYVNNYNMYKFLPKLPIDNYLNQKVFVQLSEMSSLIDTNGKEVNTLTVYAVFQPVIDVTLINEKYYAYADHFNSWDMGELAVKYYSYYSDTENSFTSGTETTSRVINETSSTISEAKNNIMTSNAYIASNSLLWSELCSDSVVNAYNASMLESKVYSSFRDIQVLAQNIENEQYNKYTWVPTTLSLSMSSMPKDVEFYAWQYYNWNENVWLDINYSYTDKSFGMSASGDYTTINCYTSNYNLNLASLYNEIMPYAISTTDKKNIDADRPLLIRANVYKTVTVKLTQFVYSEDLNGEIDERPLNSSIVYPEIDSGSVISSNSNYASRSMTNGCDGIYEYGSTIRIINNAANIGGNILNANGTIRYRFLGWFIERDDTIYYMDNSEYDSSGLYTYDVMLTCVSDNSVTDFEFMAYYVAQYKQTIYSYNVSGGSSSDYDIASGSYNSVFAAPKITLTAATEAPINFNVIKQMDTSVKIDYSATSTENKYYWINLAGAPYERQNTDGNRFEKTDWAFEYYFDAGLNYDLTVDTNGTISAVSLAAAKGGNNSFCTATDTLYQYIYNNEIITDFSGYYNSGKSTYYVEGTGAVDAAYLTDRATTAIHNIGNHGSATAMANEYNIRYVSTATLVFYNLTYKGGISVPSSLALTLTNGASNALTVWDEDDTYGDWNAIYNNEQVNYGANGEVVIRVTLVNVINDGYAGNYAFAFAGMMNGQGIYDTNKLYHPNSSNASLFAPMEKDSKYSRWYEIDFGSRTTTFLFGNNSYSSMQGVNTKKIGATATASKYCTLNCGDAENGYRILNTAELRNIDVFWANNDYSCKGVNKPSEFLIAEAEEEKNNAKTLFLLCTDMNLQGLTKVNKSTDPKGVTTTWKPLCEEDTGSAAGKGFDGILTSVDVNNPVFIGGIAATNYIGKYYGIFAKIVGGEINRINIDNAYINMEGQEAVGILAGYANGAEFRNIVFDKYSNWAIYGGNLFASTISNGARVFINSDAEYEGMLAGYAENCDISSISIVIKNGYSIEMSGNVTYGALIGEMSGGKLSNVEVSGEGGWLIMGAESIGAGTDVGGMFGTISNKAVVENINVNSSTNMVVGNDGVVTNAGGIVGVVDKNATVQYVTINATTDYNMMVDTDDFKTLHPGIYLFARTDSSSVSGMAGTAANGRTGIIAGYVKSGTINNYNATTKKYYRIKGQVKAHAGTMGGIVGVNSGMVNGFDLATGNGQGNQFILLAWLPASKIASFNVGGVVGANIDGKVNDCGVTGSSSTVSKGEGVWNVGHVYAFARNSVSDDGYLNEITQSEIAVDTNQTFRFNLVMGGIVGFNSGSVYNCFVKNTRLTLRVETNATGSVSNASIISSIFSWGVESGLIVGYFAPRTIANKGFYDAASLINDNLDSPSTIKTGLEALDMTTPRIQSCYSKSSSICITGRVYMDSFSVNSNYGNNSKVSAVSMAGICGGSSTEASHDFSINSCYAFGNKYFYKVVPWGRTNGSESSNSPSYGFYRWKFEKFGAKDIYYSAPIRAFYDCDLAIATLVAGVNRENTANSSNFFMESLFMSDVVESSNLGSEGLTDEDSGYFGGNGYPPGNTTRYTRLNASRASSYVNTEVVNSGGIPSYTVYGYRPYTTDDESDSFFRGNIIATNPKTGDLMACVTRSTAILKIGYINENGERVYDDSSYKKSDNLFASWVTPSDEIYGFYANEETSVFNTLSIAPFLVRGQ